MDVPVQSTWSPRAKALASLLVALHLLAVFLAPMAFAAYGRSDAVNPVERLFRPYIQALFLNHGYAFFAPDPGPSHLVEYELTFDNGRKPEKGRFPDIHEHYPRLLYHRHFMLSESLQTYYVPARAPQFPPDMDAAESSRQLERWRAARDEYELLRDSYARHLAAANHAKSAEVHRLRHDLILRKQFTRERNLDDPVQLNDPRTYDDLDRPRAPAPARATVEEYLPGISLPRGDQ